MNQEAPFIESGIIKSIIIRVSKSDSSFVYFILESNENLAFYSTLKESLNMEYRDVQINTTPELYTEVMDQISHLKEKFPIEVLKEFNSSNL